MNEIEHDANQALDEYVTYMEFEGDDEENEELRWEFIDSAVALLEKLTGRKVGDELVY